MARKDRKRNKDITSSKETEMLTEETPLVPDVKQPEVTPMAKQQIKTVEPEKKVEEVKTTTVVKTAEVLRLESLQEKYKELISNKTNTDADKKRIISVFVSIMDLVIGSNDRAVFETYYSFYLKNRKTMVSPNQALIGLSKFSDKARISQITAFFATFSALAESKIMRTAFTLNISAIRAAFKNEQLVNWIIAKR